MRRVLLRGRRAAPHKACHAYHVVDNLSFPLFTLDWGADEELLLLEAVEMYGLGNWTEVSEHGGTKSKLQCHAHARTYVNSPTAPLPDMSKVLGKEYAREEPKEEPKEKKRKTADGEEDEEDARRRRRWRPRSTGRRATLGQRRGTHGV